MGSKKERGVFSVKTGKFTTNSGGREKKMEAGCGKAQMEILT